MSETEPTSSRPLSRACDAVRWVAEAVAVVSSYAAHRRPLVWQRPAGAAASLPQPGPTRPPPRFLTPTSSRPRRRPRSTASGPPSSRSRPQPEPGAVHAHQPVTGGSRQPVACMAGYNTPPRRSAPPSRPAQRPATSAKAASRTPHAVSSAGPGCSQHLQPGRQDARTPARQHLQNRPALARQHGLAREAAQPARMSQIRSPQPRYCSVYNSQPISRGHARTHAPGRRAHRARAHAARHARRAARQSRCRAGGRTPGPPLAIRVAEKHTERHTESESEGANRSRRE